MIREEKWDDNWSTVARMWGMTALVTIGVLGGGGLALNLIKNQSFQPDSCRSDFEPTAFFTKVDQIGIANICIDDPGKTRIDLGGRLELRTRGSLGNTGLTKAELWQGKNRVATGICSKDRCSFTIGSPVTY